MPLDEKDLPRRIQRKRTKGWRMPKSAVYVGRPTKWGNCFRFARPQILVDRFFNLLLEGEYQNGAAWSRQMELREHIIFHIAELRGKDLVCWCPLYQPCHADILLELANK